MKQKVGFGYANARTIHQTMRQLWKPLSNMSAITLRNPANLNVPSTNWTARLFAQTDTDYTHVGKQPRGRMQYHKNVFPELRKRMNRCCTRGKTV